MNEYKEFRILKEKLLGNENDVELQKLKENKKLDNIPTTSEINKNERKSDSKDPNREKLLIIKEIKLEIGLFKFFFSHIHLYLLMSFQMISHFSFYPGYFLRFQFQGLSRTFINISICLLVSFADFTFRFLPAFVMLFTRLTICYSLIFRFIMLANIFSIPFLTCDYMVCSIIQSNTYKFISIFLYIATFSYPLVCSVRLVNKIEFKNKEERNIANNLICLSQSAGYIFAGLVGTFLLAKI